MRLANRRKQTRHYSDLSADICVLESKTHIQGRVVNLASNGIAIYSPQQIEPGGALSISYRGVLILAEVVYCIPVDGGYRAGAAIDQALATVNAELSVGEAVSELTDITAGQQLQALTRVAHA